MIRVRILKGQNFHFLTLMQSKRKLDRKKPIWSELRWCSLLWLFFKLFGLENVPKNSIRLWIRISGHWLFLLFYVFFNLIFQDWFYFRMSFLDCSGVFLLATAVKILTMLKFDLYHSTDFDVHRNWLAVTLQEPIRNWYFERKQAKISHHK